LFAPADKANVRAQSVSGATGCQQSACHQRQEWPGRAKAKFMLAAVNQSSKAGQFGKF
jgi:hypothetical protein